MTMYRDPNGRSSVKVSSSAKFYDKIKITRSDLKQEPGFEQLYSRLPRISKNTVSYTFGLSPDDNVQASYVDKYGYYDSYDISATDYPAEHKRLSNAIRKSHSFTPYFTAATANTIASLVFVPKNIQFSPIGCAMNSYGNLREIAKNMAEELRDHRHLLDGNLKHFYHDAEGRKKIDDFMILHVPTWMSATNKMYNDFKSCEKFASDHGPNLQHPVRVLWGKAFEPPHLVKLNSSLSDVQLTTALHEFLEDREFGRKILEPEKKTISEFVQSHLVKRKNVGLPYGCATEKLRLETGRAMHSHYVEKSKSADRSSGEASAKGNESEIKTPSGRHSGDNTSQKSTGKNGGAFSR